jgi:hypothetical protein
MLDAFQSAAMNISASEIGALVAICEFYPAIIGAAQKGSQNGRWKVDHFNTGA